MCRAAMHCTLYTVYCTQCTVYYVLYTVYCTQCTVHTVLYTVYCTQCTLYSVYCRDNSAQCTVHSRDINSDQILTGSCDKQQLYQISWETPFGSDVVFIRGSFGKVQTRCSKVSQRGRLGR